MPKLAKLPDRTPVKLTLTISPELNKALTQYADHYNQAYGNVEPEPVTELVPYMIQSFLDGDKEFVRAMKKDKRAGAETTEVTNIAGPRGQRRTANAG